MTQPDPSSFTAASLADPSVTPAMLAELAGSRRDLWTGILAHPNCYPALAEWIRQQLPAEEAQASAGAASDDAAPAGGNAGAVAGANSDTNAGGDQAGTDTAAQAGADAADQTRAGAEAAPDVEATRRLSDVNGQGQQFGSAGQGQFAPGGQQAPGQFGSASQGQFGTASEGQPFGGQPQGYGQPGAQQPDFQQQGFQQPGFQQSGAGYQQGAQQAPGQFGSASQGQFAPGSQQAPGQFGSASQGQFGSGQQFQAGPQASYPQQGAPGQYPQHGAPGSYPQPNQNQYGAPGYGPGYGQNNFSQNFTAQGASNAFKQTLAGPLLVKLRLLMPVASVLAILSLFLPVGKVSAFGFSESVNYFSPGTDGEGVILLVVFLLVIAASVVAILLQKYGVRLGAGIFGILIGLLGIFDGFGTTANLGAMGSMVSVGAGAILLGLFSILVVAGGIFTLLPEKH